MDGGSVWSVAFSPDGTRLASGSNDGRVRIWDVTTGNELEPLGGHDARVLALAFTGDGTLLASGGAEGSVRLWDPASGEERSRLATDGGQIAAVAFNNDGTLLAGGSAEGGVRLWDLRPFLLLANGPAPSPRAALVSETLQRLWGVRIDGLARAPETWSRLVPREGYYLDQEVEIDVRPPAGGSSPTGGPVLRTFDIRPLLDPPAPGRDKLDQVLQWLAAQQPRLQP